MPIDVEQPPFPFKKCPMCGFTWNLRDDFLSDRSVVLKGYQVNFEILRLGFFLFDHSCGTTMGVQAALFTDLHDGPVFARRMVGMPECPDYCTRPDELSPCRARCECAWVRDLLQVVREWPKTGSGVAR